MDLIRCLPGRVNMGSQEQAEHALEITPCLLAKRFGRCASRVWSLGMLASMLTPSAVAIPLCVDGSDPGIQLGDRHHPVSPPDVLGAAGTRSSARHPCCLRHKASRDLVSMRLGLHNECLELVAVARLLLWFRSTVQ